jgi:DNA repair photolyase
MVRGEVIREFDPWHDPLCSCPSKYGFNPYTGCGFSCRYCYITSYIPRAFECRAKKNLVKRVKLDLESIDRRRVISISNSSDPYPMMEAKLELTRSCLGLFAKQGLRVQLITKSDLISRDIGLLSGMSSVCSFTITTLDPELSTKIEPNAPGPKARLEAMKKLSDAGVPVTLRLDPVMPYLNDSEVERIVEAAATRGACHVTSSTLKPRPDSWHRLQLAFPRETPKLAWLYTMEGDRHQKSSYLPARTRAELMLRVRDACNKYGLTFSSCREGLNKLNSGKSCDGSHLIPT